MAVPANTKTTDIAVGNREDLSDELTRISPYQTPFYSNIGTGKVDAVFTEWQTEALRAPSAANAHLEGDDTAITAPNIRTRLGNRTQIFKESVSVSGTQEAVDKAAVADEYDHQKMLKLEALKTDMEITMLSGQASNEENEDAAGVADAGAPRRLGGARAFFETNVSRGATGANGGYSGKNVQAPTNGTQRAFTEALLKEVLLARFTASGEPATNLQGYMSGVHKQQFGSFAGLSETRDSVKGQDQRVIYGAADVYVGDFGTITAIPHAYALTRDVVIIKPDHWKKANLRATTHTPLARTGDTEKGQIIGECTLKCLSEKSSSIIADLT